MTAGDAALERYIPRLKKVLSAYDLSYGLSTD